MDLLYKYIGLIIVLCLISCTQNRIVDLELGFEDRCYLKLGDVVIADTVGIDHYYFVPVNDYVIIYRSYIDSELVMIVIPEDRNENKGYFEECNFTGGVK